MQQVLASLVGDLKVLVKGSGEALAKITSGAIADKPDPTNPSKKGILSVFQNGTTTKGPAFTQLNNLLSGMGYKAVVTDGILKLYDKTGDTMSLIPFISPSTGLIGSPEIGKDGIVKFKSLLQQELQPFHRVQLQSTHMPLSTYLIHKVTHMGDTRGAEWYTEVEAEPLKAGG